MADDNLNIEAMMSDDFLESLSESNSDQVVTVVPEWVVDDIDHTTYKVWQAILQLQNKKELQIKCYGKVCTSKTPKSLYEIKKSEVASAVGISAQSIFRASKFSPLVLEFFNYINDILLEFHEKEQVKQKKRKINTGIRSKKKIIIVKSHQEIEKELNQLKAKATKEVLDLAINQMPLDLKLKLGF